MIRPGMARLWASLGGEEGGVRAAIAHGHAEALGRAEDDVGAQLAGRGEQGQRQEVGGDDGEAALRLDGGDRRGAGRGSRRRCRDTGQQGAEHGPGPSSSAQRVADDQLDAQMARRGCAARPGSADGSRVDEEAVGLVAADPVRHGHGLGGGGGLVEQRGVGQLHAGEVDHHLLEVEQGLEPALADLGLVGRVGRVPAGVLQHVAQDHRRGVGAVIAHADQRGGDRLRWAMRAQGGQRLGLGARRGAAPAAAGADRGRHGPVDQLVQRAGADGWPASRPARPRAGRYGGRRRRRGSRPRCGSGSAWSGDALEVGVVGGPVHQALGLARVARP